MKKILSILLAVGVIFAFVSCSDGGGGGGGSSKITISFEYDEITAAQCDDFTPVDPPEAVKIKKGQSLGVSFPANAVCGNDGDDGCYVFIGWYDGATKATSTTTFSKSTKLVGMFGPDTRPVLTFEKLDGSVQAVVKISEGSSFEAEGKTIPTHAARDGYDFGFWYIKNGAETTKLEAATIIDASATYVVKWYSKALTVDGAQEVLFLENGAFAFYKFDLDGQKWQDFDKIQVSYKVSEAQLAKGIRAWRLMGIFFEDDFDADKDDDAKSLYGEVSVGDAPKVKSTGVDENGAKYIKLGGWGNNAHILDNATRSWATANGGAAVVADTWFTVSYDITGGQKHAQWADGATLPLGPEDFPAMPANDYDGVFYVALGISGGYGSKNAPADGVIQFVKDIKLVPKASATDAEEVVSDGSGFTEQTFLSNVDEVVFSYRGDPNDPVVIPPPPYVPPPQFDYTYTRKDSTNPALVAFLNDDASDDNPISVAGNVGTVALTEDHVGNNKMILIPFPALTSEDWKKFEFVEITLDLVLTDGQQILLSTPGSKFTNSTGAPAVVNGVAWGTWDTWTSGNKVIKIPTTGMNDMTDEAQGILIRPNANAANNMPANWVITVTKISLIPAVEPAP